MPLELEFERPITELEQHLKELQALSEERNIDLSREVNAIQEKIRAMRDDIYRSLEPWQVTQIARHIDRPSTADYLKRLCGDTFVELHGDRLYADDSALLTGLGRIDGRPVAIIGHQKGHDTNENLHRNFGMPHPEGYRKAMRLMRLAEKFGRPIIVFIDTPGAFPGIGAEERGQAEAIARSIREMSRCRVPILCFVIGEGGSGGALAIGVGDRVFMLEYSVYSVISAEGCAAILWKDAAKSKEAAVAMKMRAGDLLEFGVIDDIIAEPVGGAHRDYDAIAASMKEVINRHLPELLSLSSEELVERRYRKYRSLGKFKDQQDMDDA